MTAALVFALIFLGASRSMGLLGDRLLERMRTLAPWPRSWTLLLLAASPFILAAFVALSVFVPLVAGLVIDMHCHEGVCARHAPSVLPAFPLGLALLALALSPLLAAALLGTVAAWRAARFARMLEQLARPGVDRGYQILESEETFAMSTGLLRRRVLISSALLSEVSEEQLEAIGVHERAHAYRFDNLRRLIASLLTLLWPRAVRACLLKEVSLAAEQACDQMVSQAMGVKVVAKTIIRLRARQLAHRLPEDSQACAGEGVDRGAQALATLQVLDPTTAARLHALEQPKQWRGLPRGGIALVALFAALQVVLLAQLIHHGLEAVLH